MAGFLGDFGNWLIQDPNAPPGASQASGGLLGAGTPTASTQTPTQPSSAVPYALQPLPQSRLGILLQGILSGLGTTGYKGSAAVGAGANAALEGQMRQRQLNANMTMQGQQYLQGRQQLAQGNLQLANMVRQYNLQNQMFNPQAPQLTLQDVMNDPGKLALVQNMSGFFGGGTQQPGAQQPQQGQQSQIPLQMYYQAFQSNEGSGPNATSSAGAKGVYQIMPGTFKQYAHPGESFDNERDRETVAQRYIGDLYSKYGQNPDQMAAAYFAGNPNADPNASDGHWTVAQYQQNLRQNLGMGAAGGVGPQGQTGASDAFTNDFGMTPQQMIMMGRKMMLAGIPGGKEYMDMGAKYDPALARQLAQAGWGPQAVKPGSVLDVPDANGNYHRADEVPQKIETYDPQTGNFTPANQDAAGNVTPAGNSIVKLGPGNEKLQEGFATRRTEMGDAVNGGIVAEQRLNAMADAFKSIQSGTFATEKAQIGAGLKGVGIDVGDALGDPAAMNQVLHDNVLATFAMIKPLVGGRVAQAEIQMLSNALPNLGLQPEANLKILAQLQGVMRYNRDLYDGLSKQPGNTDPNEFEIQFNKQHPLTGYVADAEKQIGPLKGMEGSGQTASTAAPKVGATQTYKGQKWKFNGGDPKMPDNWSLING